MQRGNVRRVIIESPFAGDIERNLRYLRACMDDCRKRGEAPFASHALYTQPGVLDDTNPEERTEGIEMGFAWRHVADATVVYKDLGVSRGMTYGIKAAEDLASYNSTPGHGHHVIEERVLGDGWEQRAIEREIRMPNAWCDSLNGGPSFPCGWSTPRVENGAVAWWALTDDLIPPDEAEALGLALARTAREARR